MTWHDLLNQRRVKPHTTSKQEIADLLTVVRRDLSDARVDGLSDDRRFATAYNAALQLSKIVIACSGYRVSGSGHHATSFEALETALGPAAAQRAAYLDACRLKRNFVEYDVANVATEAEAEALIAEAEQFLIEVEEWLASQFPQLI